MKQVFLLITFLWVIPVFSQDCFFCPAAFVYGLPQFQEWPIEYTKIEKVFYERNQDASFCKRPPEIVDTIVLHHSESPGTDSPERINWYHLQRGVPSDPWYMMGYSYTINAPYPGSYTPRMRVTEGRPLDLVGAHAGSNAFSPLDQEQRRMWDEGKVTCGKEGEEFKVDEKLMKDGKLKANITTVGVVVIGNYAPISRTNIFGFSPSNPRYPTPATQDLIARLSCQLQKKYPRIRNIKWHNFYHPTSCPGTIQQYIGRIKTLARKYGCTFN